MAVAAAQNLGMVAMTESFLHPSWYRIATLKPRLRAHVQLHRHSYRGQIWYVSQDAGTGRFHRFTPAAHQLIGLMDGQRTMQQIWEAACEREGDDAPTQGEVLQLLHQLHAADMLRTDLPPDTDDMVRRYDRQRRAKWLQQLRSPLAIRVPLFDPDRFLTAALPWVKPMFGWFGALLWIAVVGAALLLTVLHWPELSRNVSDNILTPQNLLLIALIYPIIKTFHELGHAFTVKAFGGEVHRIGIMLLVLMPVPYVDASASIAYQEKWRRALVAAAGMLVEIFIAALALLVWIAAEPGSVRTLAYNTAFVGSVSTVLFNGNPLLRYDGYYLLCDLIEIPNLGKRSTGYLLYLLKRYGFGNHDAISPATARGERIWFVGYAVIAFVYRLVLYIGIGLFVASRFFVVGVLIALWSLFGLLVLPLLKGLKYLLTGPELRRERPRAVLVSVGLVSLVLCLLFLLPLPLATLADGIVWVPEGTMVRANTGGFVRELSVWPQQQVAAGEVMLVLEDPDLPVELRVLEQKLAALDARYRFFFHDDRVQAAITREEMNGVETRLARKREAMRELKVRAPVAGTAVVPNAEDLPGRFVAQGSLLAYVLTDQPGIVRVAVTQDVVDLVRQRTQSVSVRSADDLETVLPAQLRREVPSASQELPSAALGTIGGGAIPIDPRDETGRTSFEKVFLFDLELPANVHPAGVGSRIHVRFAHGWEPVGFRLYRNLRQLFLSQLDV